MHHLLNQIFPADEYIQGGTPTEVQLSCYNNSGFPVANKISKVLLTIVNDPEFGVVEVNQWGENVIYATKIVDSCDGSVVYVVDYINDVLPWVNCCGIEHQQTGFFLLTEDGQPILGEDGQPLIPEIIFL